MGALRSAEPCRKEAETEEGWMDDVPGERSASYLSTFLFLKILLSVESV